jgi:hypothetical protein
MALRQEVGVVSDPEAAERGREVVRRYVTDALFGGDERALRDTVADPVLVERAWLFWAAFSERSLHEVDELFANADGSRVACHLTGNMIQEGPWITAAAPSAGGLVMIECTGIYAVADGKITNFRETWR